MLGMIVALFWFGFWICVAIFVFELVLYVVMIGGAAIIAGLIAAWEKITGR